MGNSDVEFLWISGGSFAHVPIRILSVMLICCSTCCDVNVLALKARAGLTIYIYVLDNFAGRYTWKAWWCNIKSIKTSSIKSPRPWWQLAALPEEYWRIWVARAFWKSLRIVWKIQKKSALPRYGNAVSIGFQNFDPTLGTTLWLFMMFMFYLMSMVICIQLFGLWETLWSRPSSSLEVAFPATNHQNILLWIFIHSKKENICFHPSQFWKNNVQIPIEFSQKNEAFNRFEHDWFIMKP